MVLVYGRSKKGEKANDQYQLLALFDWLVI